MQAKKAFRQLALLFHPDKALGHCKFSHGLHATCRPALTHGQVCLLCHCSCYDVDLLPLWQASGALAVSKG